MDGGLVNPVLISLCRALGADIVIGVDVSQGLLDKNRPWRPRLSTPGGQFVEAVREDLERTLGAGAADWYNPAP
ncbi:MAG: hypothetical protein JF614_27110 [Acidobacteria bacterium]|nr:hypothetical protein [Acidobacteriota bacterium]